MENFRIATISCFSCFDFMAVHGFLILRRSSWCKSKFFNGTLLKILDYQVVGWLHTSTTRMITPINYWYDSKLWRITYLQAIQILHRNTDHLRIIFIFISKKWHKSKILTVNVRMAKFVASKMSRSRQLLRRRIKKSRHWCNAKKV